MGSDRLFPSAYPLVQSNQSCVKGMRPKDPGVLMPSSEHSGQDLGATYPGQLMPQQHGLKVPTPWSSPRAAHFTEAVHLSPPQDQAEGTTLKVLQGQSHIPSYICWQEEGPPQCQMRWKSLALFLFQSGSGLWERKCR